jgi:hypothetical protein
VERETVAWLRLGRHDLVSRVLEGLLSRMNRYPILTNLVNSIVLITNGLSFAFQAVIFLLVGSFADYGVWRPHITTAFTVLAWAVSFGWLGVEDASK